MKKFLVLFVSHVIAAAIGFAAGIYWLPILTAPQAPSAKDIEAKASGAEFKGAFRRELKGSDFFHWGEGAVGVSSAAITLMGKLAPGPDYKLYLSPEFVETEADFLRLKPQMARVGDVKTFENFIVPVPSAIDPRQFNTVIVWCESFGQFITAAKYR